MLPAMFGPTFAGDSVICAGDLADADPLMCRLRALHYGTMMSSGRRAHKSQRKKQPEKPETWLQFSLEEAFFLIQHETAFQVKMPPGQVHETALSEQELWQCCCAAMGAERFASLYTAYRHYRQAGWIVKSGIMYGTNFVLYRGGIDLFHADYCVAIQRPEISWLQLQGLTRMMVDICKTLILCAPFHQDAPASEQSSSVGDLPQESLYECVDCLRRMAVSEVTFKSCGKGSSTGVRPHKKPKLQKQLKAQPKTKVEQGSADKNRSSVVSAGEGARIVVLVGLPGSGKSTVAQMLLTKASQSVVVISQDELGSVSLCEAAVRSALCEGSTVVVDRVNGTKAQRARWVSVAQDMGLLRRVIVAVVVDTPFSQCVLRVNSSDRADHPTLPASMGDAARAKVVEAFSKSFEPLNPQANDANDAATVKRADGGEGFGDIRWIDGNRCHDRSYMATQLSSIMELA